VVGQRLEGRLTIVEDLGKAHQSWAKTTTVAAVGVPSVRVVRDDVAIVTIDSGNSLMLVVDRHAGRSRIISGQVAKPVKQLECACIFIPSAPSARHLVAARFVLFQLSRDARCNTKLAAE